MKIIYLIVFSLLSLSAKGQKLPGYGVDKIRISDTSGSIVAEVYPVERPPKTSNKNFYYWYSAGMIHNSQGGYDGKLLNGKYSETYINKNLKKQGTFIAGQKNGIWKEWSNNGTLRKIETWKKGQKSGQYYLYDSTRLVQSGRFQDGILNGPVSFYSQDSIEIKHYHNGKLVTTGKDSFWKKIKIFSRKLKNDTVSVKQ